MRPVLVSAANGFGFPALADQVTALGNQVLFMGITNVGKSSVLQRLLRMRIGGGKRKQIEPTVSSSGNDCKCVALALSRRADLG